MEEIKSVVAAVLKNLENPETAKRQKLTHEWETIVGKKLFSHTRATLGKDGTLYVWVSESALAFELNQKYKPTILKRTQAVLGEEAVKEIRFKVGEWRA